MRRICSDVGGECGRGGWIVLWDSKSKRKYRVRWAFCGGDRGFLWRWEVGDGDKAQVEHVQLIKSEKCFAFFS